MSHNSIMAQQEQFLQTAYDFITRTRNAAGWYEFRLLGPDKPRALWWNGDDAQLQQILAECVYWNERGYNVYLTMNPCAEKPEGSARDENITSRHLILIDADPVRPKLEVNGKPTDHIPTTFDERRAAVLVIRAVQDYLQGKGITPLVLVDSGNGAQLYLQCDLPNDAQATELVHRLLQLLDKRFGSDAAHIDTSVHNASRIARVPGFINYKGPELPGRQHRKSRVVRWYEQPTTLDADMLKRFVNDLQEKLGILEEKPAEPKRNGKHNGNGKTNDEVTPADWFNQHITLDALVALAEQHGYQPVGQREDYYEMTRPGKDAGISGGFTDLPGAWCYHNFSTNDPYLQENQTVSAFAFYARVEHAGDMSSAAKAVVDGIPELGIPPMPNRKSLQLPDDSILTHVTELLTRAGRDKLGPQEKDAVLERAFRELVQSGRLFRDAKTSEPYLLYGRQLARLDKENIVTQMALHKWMYLNPQTEVYKQVVADLILRARQDAPTIHIAHWQEYRDGKLYISCGREHLVRVDDSGIHKLENGTDDVWFDADSSYQEWTPTTPVDPLSLQAFKPSVEAPAEAPRYTPDDQYRLAVAWMIARLAAFEQLPLLVNRGGRGSGKSEWAKAIVRTFNPNDTVQDAPSDQRDFSAKLVHDAIIALDNVDEDVPGWLKDAIARTVTGTRVRQRKLYTNYEVAEAEPRAGIIITSRTAAWARADVAERAVILCAAPMEGRRIDDETLKAQVLQHRDGVLTYLAQHAWDVRQMIDQAPELLGRFVNFSRCAWAYGQLVGWDAVPALRSNAVMQSVIAADSDPLVSALLEHWTDISDGRQWTGTPTELVKDLTDAGARLPHYGGGKAIAGVLRELRPVLKQVGFLLTERKQGNQAVFTITRFDDGDDDDPQPTSQPPTRDANDIATVASRTGESGEKNQNENEPALSTTEECRGNTHLQQQVWEREYNNSPVSPDSPALKENGAIQQYQELLSSSVSHLRSEEHAERSLVHSCHYKEGGERMDAQTDEQMDALREWLLSEFAGRRVSWKEIQSHVLQSFSRFPVTRDLLIQAVRQLMDSAQVSRTADSQGTGWYQFPEAEDPFAEDEGLILARAEALEYQADLILGILRKANRPLTTGQILSKMELKLSTWDMEYYALLGAYARDALQMLLDAGKVDRVNGRIVARPVKRSVEQPFEPLLAELDGTA